ncbi:hypothetical protein KIW84_015155 [Lathyrus oleraceus]|uniref:Putative plant transposon protein domain-containing protein n=1 Tax=Pisum sativum TaxID=3888 RepID=A0A9D5BQ02_PEA|nr:hypothetical protein KIW84_015155 [Pisum sativum]
MVRGRTIRFYRNSINEYLGDLITLLDGELCAYARYLDHGSWNIEEISESILLEGRSVQLNSSEVPIRFLREDMKPSSQVILLLILHNIKPRNHTSFIPLETSYLLYFILNNI